MTTARIQTVGDLRHLLRNASDDTPLTVAVSPDDSGWTDQLLLDHHEDDDGVFLAVVEFAELFIDRRAENTGDPVRPV